MRIQTVTAVYFSPTGSTERTVRTVAQSLADALGDALKERLEWHRYGCGHMAYVDEPTLRQMSADMEAFYNKQ